MVENPLDGTVIDLTHYFNCGEVRYEVLNTLENLRDDTLTIIPTIKIKPITLAKESICIAENANNLITRIVYKELNELLEEIRKLT
jgi:hypothetical protein